MAESGITHAVVTYNELDGACAAAMVLRAHQDAELYITSAYRIDVTLRELLDGVQEDLKEVHICGLGVYCELQHVILLLKELKSIGVQCFWYCGRGYLNNIKGKLNRVCETVFHDQAGTNTGAVCRHLRLQADPRAQLLMKTARETRRSGDRDVQALRNLAYAKMARYFKLYDLEAYPAAIRKLAGLSEITEGDRAEVEHYEQVRMDFALQGRSRAIKLLRRRIAAVAKSGFATVFILGPSGVGKERVARLLYEESPRHGKPFVAVNCANFNANSDLADSSLFGHSKGAFTGATHDNPGIFEQANGGTLFLDEIGELPLPVQGKLLRVLQEGTIDPVGKAGAAVKVDVRIIAATNRDPHALFAEEKFREDLFYRLNVIRLDVPPLSARKEDIPIIAISILEELKKNYQDVSSKLADEQIQALQDYDWPGNVRQMQSILERSVVFKEPNLSKLIEEEKAFQNQHLDESSDDITDDYLSIQQSLGQGILLPDSADELLSPDQLVSLRELERIYVRRAIKICGGNKSKTARTLGITLNTLKAKERGN